MQEPTVSFTTAFPPDIGADITALLKTVTGGDLITLLGTQPCAPHEVPPVFDPTWAYALEFRPTLESGVEFSVMRVMLGQLRHTDRWGIWSLISRD